MKNIIPYNCLVITCLMLLLTAGCKKFLDEKPGSKLVVPATTRDLQALLDNYNVLNANSPAAPEVSADNYYLTVDDYNRLGDDLKRMYTWQPDHLFDVPPNDWSNIYRTIMVANTVIGHSENLPAGEEKNNILGQAYFWRGFSFQKAVAIWALAYDPPSAATDLGIPLRLNINFNEVSVRSSVEASYSQIIDDFRKAIQWLPVNNIHVARPSLAAAYGMLARTFLYMRQYDSVYKYAHLALQLKNDPQNFNDTRIAPAANFPFSTIKYNNADILFYASGPPTLALAVTRGRVDSNLYNSYANNDLRKTIFFRRIIGNEYGFKGSYEGGNALFAGITVGELYLMRAEALCRAGKLSEALSDLNFLLSKRWKSGTWVPLSASNQNTLLQMILAERRKETIMRGLRWMDIKRLNKEGAGISLNRKIENTMYHLPAGSLKFALPLPEDVIELSGMPRNPR